MKFRNWLESQDVNLLAYRLKVCSQTIYMWKEKKAIPKSTRLQELVRLGKGEFDVFDIINDTKKRGKGC